MAETIIAHSRADLELSDHQFVFLVYTQNDKEESEIIGVFSSMSEAEKLLLNRVQLENWNMTLRNRLKNEIVAVIISQIPLNISIANHMDYVMKVVEVNRRNSF